jgi:hypothetical protein
VVNIEHWTSGTDRGYDANYVWCSTKNFLNMTEVNWKSGQPNSADGHCMFVQFSNKSANQTSVSMGDCSQKRKFICQVMIYRPLNLKILLSYLLNNNYPILCTEEYGNIRGRSYAVGVHVFVRFNRGY